MINKKSKLPAVANRLLKLSVDEDTYYTAVEDFEVSFVENLEKMGYFRARLVFWYNVLSLSIASFFYLFTWRISMIRNYFKITIRNIFKHKGFSFINIFSLSAGMAIGFLAIQFVAYFYTFDKFHDNGERIFRANTSRSSKMVTKRLMERFIGGEYATSPLPLSQALLNEINGIEKAVTIKTDFMGSAVFNKNKINMSGYYSSSDFFNLFSYELERGNPDTALVQPYSIVLTQKLSDKFFKGIDPIGNVLKIKKLGDFVVTGVLKETSKLRSHLQFESLISISTLASLEKRKIITPITENWDNLHWSYSYILLRENVSPKEIEASFPGVVKKYFNNEDYNYRLFLQPITTIIPGKGYRFPFYQEYPFHGLFLLLVLAFIILLVVIFNYTNLSIARYLTRTREVGIRKVIGASRFQVFSQFIGEAVIIALISLVFAYAFSKYLIYLMIHMVPGHPPPVEFDENVIIFTLFFLYALLAGFLAGILPALNFSKLKPIKVLQNLFSVKVLSHIVLRKAIIVFQFTLSLIFIIFTIVVFKQIQFYKKCDFGFSPDNIVNVRLDEVKYETYRNEILRNNDILEVSASEDIPGLGNRQVEKVREDNQGEYLSVGALSIDQNFIKNLNIKLLAGENFPDNLSSKNEKFVIISESTVKRLKYGNIRDALGKTLIIGENTPVQIIGVVKDFFYYYLYSSSDQGLLALRYKPDHFKYANIKINPKNTNRAITILEKTWDRLVPDTPFTYSKYEEEIAHTLLDYQVLLKTMRFLALMLIAIASLGLLGMAFYSAETKKKEIGIRKVVGASIFHITKFLTKGYFNLLVIAIFIAAPISWILCNFFLQQFVYRIRLGIDIFLLGIFIMLVCGLGTVLSQTVKAAVANPIDSLKYE